MAREHHMVRYWREVREIADEDGVSVDVARARWSERYERVGLKRRAQRIVIALTATAATTFCPFCRDDLGTEALHTCGRCDTRFHQECWIEGHENCTTLGCAARRALRFPRPAPTPPPTIPAPTNVRAEATDRGVNITWDRPAPAPVETPPPVVRTIGPDERPTIADTVDTTHELFCNGCRKVAVAPLIERNGAYRCFNCFIYSTCNECQHPLVSHGALGNSDRDPSCQTQDFGLNAKCPCVGWDGKGRFHAARYMALAFALLALLALMAIMVVLAY